MLHHLLAESDAFIGIRSIVGDGGAAWPLAHRQSVGNGCIVPHLTIGVRIGKIYELSNLLYGSTCRNSHRGLSRGTTLGGNEDNTVSTAHTEYSCSRGVFQNRDVLNLVRVELSEGTLHTVDEYQRFCTVQRTCTTHADDGFISTRHT